MAEQKSGDPDAYDGPMILKRIEYFSKITRESVELFGSWNRYVGGDNLEYQGQNTWAIDVKVPLGNYVYRFLVDAEEWETNNDIAKTVKDGDEFNTITVRQNDDESSDEEESAEDEEADDGGEQTLTYDESTGGFIVGKSKKRRGRPSIEIELPSTFVEDAQKKELPGVAEADGKGDASGGATSGDPDSKKAPATGSKKRKRRNKRKMRGFGGRIEDNESLKALFKQKEEEWARMVFVQQLRQQQQHNDEINRVKTLWKQERQVRVEMHKKVVQQKKKLGQRVLSLEAEVDKMKKQLEIGAAGDTKRAAQLEETLAKKNAEIEKLIQDVKSAKDDLTASRREKVEFEKRERSQAGDMQNEKKKLNGEISRLTNEVQSLKSQNQSLMQNIETIKSGNKQTREMETSRFASLQSVWEDEKRDLLKYKETSNKLKEQLDQKENELQAEADAKKAAQQATAQSESKREALEAKIKKLDAQIVELSDTSKANDAVRVAVEKQRMELEGVQKTLTEKVAALEGRLAEQKGSYEAELAKVQKQAAADLSALSEKSDKQATQRVDELRKEISQRDDEIRGKSDEIAKLGDALNAEKNNVASLEKKSAALEGELNDAKKSNTELEACKADLTSQVGKLTDDLKEATSTAALEKENAASKISSLEASLASTKESNDAAKNELEEQIAKMSEQIESLKSETDSKAAEAGKLSQELSQAKQDLETLRASETSLKQEVGQLNETLSKEREDSQNQLKSKDAEIDKISSDMEKAVSEKEAEIQSVSEKLRASESQLQSKLKEFASAEVQLAQLRTELDSNAKLYEKEKAHLEKQVAHSQAKDEKILKACKGLSAKFGELRTEMDAVRNEKIQQLEKMNDFFPNFKDLLTKAFGFHQGLVDDLMEKYKRELTLRRKYFNIVQDLRGNIRVFCRVRPLLPFEIKKGYTSCVDFPQEGMLKIKDDKGVMQKFEFDQVYDSSTNQEQVSVDTSEYVQSVMDGYNVSIFAYGQTGSGKTYTMNGPKDNPGVNLRALKHLFKMAEQRAPMFEYEIRVSILEIYNESIRDLLPGITMGKKKKKKKKEKQKSGKPTYKIMHLPDGSVEVDGLNWVPVTDDEQVVELQNKAQDNRTSGITDMNAHSSRSHMVVMVDVKGLNIPANIEYLGRLYLVDLAGSERVKKSGATGVALKEAQNINKSLSALGDVMQALQKKAKFIPYRNSTLTDIMTNSLGGNAKTVMFINCCPTTEHAYETVSSLKFAKRVGKVELGEAKATKTKKKKKSAK